ncbi:MAG: multidrug efflux SMR transporter [Hyphomicrobiales bacterium]
MAWLYLLCAIAVEVCATTSPKMSDGFSDWRFSLLSLTLYGVSFWLLSLTLRVIPVSTAYTIWSGLGVGLAAIVGILFLRSRSAR